MARSDTLPTGSRFIVLASICVVVAALYFLRDFLVPLALAVLLTFLFTPLVHRLQTWGLGRIGAVIIVMLAAIGVVAVLGYVVTLQAVDLAKQLPQYKDNIAEKVRSFTGQGAGFFESTQRAIEDVREAVEEPATTQATQPTTQEQDIGITRSPDVPAAELPGDDAAEKASAIPLPGTAAEKPLWVAVVESKTPAQVLADNFGVILGPLGIAGLVIVFVIFMLLAREDLRDRLFRLVGQQQLTITTQALDDAASRISRYLLAQAIVNGTYGVAISIGLWIIGNTVGGQTFPNFILWGLLCAIFRFIPYIGPWIAAIFPLAVAFAVYKGFDVFIATASMFVVIELLSNNLMEPWLYGSSTGMSAVAVLVAAVFWTFLWGPIGLLLSTPMTVCLVVLGKHVPQLQFLNVLLGDEPVLSPAQKLYQRVLALDHEEASDLAEAYLKEHSLEEVYDQVLLPALALAEQDRHRGRLDDTRQRFVRQAMRDLIKELGDQHGRLEEERSKADSKAGAAAVVATARGDHAEQIAVDATTGATRAARSRLPDQCVINVVCLPTHDEADEIIGLMLVQLLELLGYRAVAVSTNSLASEMVQKVQEHEAHLVCLSALPPAAVSHARYLCKRLHASDPEMKLVIGLWTFKGDVKRASERISCQADSICTTLAAALDEIHQRVQPMLVEAKRGA